VEVIRHLLKVMLWSHVLCVCADDYKNLSSPTSPGFDDSASGGGGDTIPLSLDPEERARQIKEWEEELEKVGR
jgi:hypothetical protein